MLLRRIRLGLDVWMCTVAGWFLISCAAVHISRLKMAVVFNNVLVILLKRMVPL